MAARIGLTLDQVASLQRVDHRHGIARIDGP
jgi:hypothetical protein